MSSTARIQLGLDCGDLRTKYKYEHFSSHDLHLDQEVKIQLVNGGIQLPLKTVKEPRSYIVTTKDGVQYRKTQTHLKAYQSQGKKSEDEHLLKSNHMWTVKNKHKKSHIADNLLQSRPKRDIKPAIKLNL